MNTINVHDKVFIKYLDESVLQNSVSRLADKINEDYKNNINATNPLLFVVILNGAFMFASDLLKNIKLPSEIVFMKINSYDGISSTGNVTFKLDLEPGILNNRDVIIVEDIIDTGLTMHALLSHINVNFSPKSINLCVMFLKPYNNGVYFYTWDWKRIQIRETFTQNLKYIGLEIPNKFIIGYGLDYNHIGRNSRDVYELQNT